MITCPVCGTENEKNAAVCENPDCRYQIRTAMDDSGTVLIDRAGSSMLPGGLIAGRYEVVEELGRGGMGAVFRVRDTKLRNREVALKMIHPELVVQEEARQRFIDEVLLCLELHHPNIVVVYPIEESGNSLFFTMEYIPGRNLRQILDSRHGKVPPFSLEETMSLMGQILDALSYAHKTTVHRDIKPENILVQGDFPDARIKILDFGIAKVLSASRFTRTAQSMGTAYYMSPEQMKGAKKIDLRSDLYAAGMVLYEMLTGEVGAGIFDMPSSLVPEFPETIDAVIRKTLSHKPESRYPSAQEMKQALEVVIESERVKAEEDSASLSGQSEEGEDGQDETVPNEATQKIQEFERLLKQAAGEISDKAFDKAAATVEKAEALSPRSERTEELRNTLRIQQCEQALGSAREKFAEKDFQGAKKEALHAANLCEGSRAAKDLLKKIEETQAKLKEAKDKRKKNESQFSSLIKKTQDCIRSARFDQGLEVIEQAKALQIDDAKAANVQIQLLEVRDEHQVMIRSFHHFLDMKAFDKAQMHLNNAMVTCPGYAENAKLKQKIIDARAAVKREDIQEQKEIIQNQDAEKSAKFKELLQTVETLLSEAEFEKARQSLAEAITLNVDSEQCQTTQELLEKTEQQYLDYIQEVEKAMASKDALVGERILNAISALCFRAKDMENFSKDLYELKKAQQKEKLKKRLALIMTLVVVLAGLWFLEKDRPTEHRNRVSVKPSSFKAGDTWTDSLTGMAFVYVPSGCFEMGQSESERQYIVQQVGQEDYDKYYNDETPIHKVCLEGFWMGKYEVTNRQYRQFKSKHDSGSYKGEDRNGDSQPVVKVSWKDAQAFISWLNKKSSHNFALPSEAQWEYAARGGTSTIRFWGDEEALACGWANVYDQTSKQKFNFSRPHHNCDDGYTVTSPVGRFKANGFGLYDMLGNVWEWCEDVYDAKAYAKPEHGRKNPLVTSGGSFSVFRGGIWFGGSDRVRRGGSWFSGPANVRCALRSRYAPSRGYGGLGFRLIRKD